MREKTADTAEFLDIALKTKELCQKYDVPLIVNDRLDIALAIKADGVHLGQTDMPVSMARQLLPAGAIIGVSCNNADHVKKAISEGVDYVGIGAVWGTATKKLTSPIIGVRGVGALLRELDNTGLKAVAIGGIKGANALRTLHGTVSTTGHGLDGVAVVSDIVGSTKPRDAARTLRDTVSAFKEQVQNKRQDSFNASYAEKDVLTSISKLLNNVKAHKPLIHQITNNVVTTQSANATLALGASPIMATAPEEMKDLSRVLGALLINFGTITNKEGMLLAGQFANEEKKPLVFDPVGVGATEFRRTTAAQLLNTWQASVIKGNAGELAALADSKEVQAKGVDTSGTGFSDPASFVKSLARKERCIIVLTGSTDWISDGNVVIRLDNGHPMLGDITGSGCMLGTCIATFCAGAYLKAVEDEPTSTRSLSTIVRGDVLLGAVGGVLALTIASEIAAQRADVRGTGTFLPALIDELYHLTPNKLTQFAKIQIL